MNAHLIHWLDLLVSHMNKMILNGRVGQVRPTVCPTLQFTDAAREKYKGAARNFLAEMQRFSDNHDVQNNGSTAFTNVSHVSTKSKISQRQQIA